MDCQRTQIYDLDQCKISDRNGTYGGNSGDKEGILINGEYWIVKYPKTTKTLTNVGNLLYTCSPQSEYIGSQIYRMLGYDVHDTILGIRNNKIVVACKDFCSENERLIEFRQLKNTYNAELNKKLELSLSSTSNDRYIDLSAMRIHFQYNPELQNIPRLQERFWECAIIDGFVNNNDRNNGNWGIIRKSGSPDRLAPVYDNGASFSPKVSESKLLKKLQDISNITGTMLNGVTIYSMDGEHNMLFRDFVRADLPEIKAAIRTVVPKLQKEKEEIKQFILSIPTSY